MNTTIAIRNIKPETKAKLIANAAAAGLSLSAYLRAKLDEIADAPKRPLGLLEDEFGPIGDPIDGWGF